MTEQQLAAVKQALGVLQYWDVHGGVDQPTEEAITALQAIIAKQALAQPAEVICDKDPHVCWSVRCQLSKQCKNIAPPALAQPPAWVGLEKADMPDGIDPMYDHDYFIKGMIWADAKLREKNTQQGEQA